MIIYCFLSSIVKKNVLQLLFVQKVVVMLNFHMDKPLLFLEQSYVKFCILYLQVHLEPIIHLTVNAILVLLMELPASWYYPEMC